MPRYTQYPLRFHICYTVYNNSGLSRHDVMRGGNVRLSQSAALLQAKDRASSGNRYLKLAEQPWQNPTEYGPWRLLAQSGDM